MYSIVQVHPWWTKEETEAAHQMVEETFDSDCGGWTWDPPCGGCRWCGHAMVSHSLAQGFTDPKYRASLHGLRFWPILRTEYRHDSGSFPHPVSHDRSHWWTQGECREPAT